MATLPPLGILPVVCNLITSDRTLKYASPSLSLSVTEEWYLDVEGRLHEIPRGGHYMLFELASIFGGKCAQSDSLHYGSRRGYMNDGVAP